jgi:hypothetical protein
MPDAGPGVHIDIGGAGFFMLSHIVLYIGGVPLLNRFPDSFQCRVDSFANNGKGHDFSL